MSRLLFVFERDMPTVSITREVFMHLHEYDEIQSTFMYMTDVKPSDIDGHDVIILMRPSNVYSWKIAAAARDAGHVVATFCDDDLLDLPPSLPTVPWRRKGLIKTLANSDVIWSCSRRILKKYRDLTAGKRTAIMDTIVRPEEIDGVEAACNEKVRIVYAAASSHSALFEKYIAPIAPRLAEEYDLSFTFVSVHPELKGVPCEYYPGMPLLEYRKFMREGRFDIGVAPLFNDDFSKCKYFNKYLEYTIQGAVGIYSNMEPYTYVVSDGRNGFLAQDDPEDWYRALKEAIQDRFKRKQCVENAINHLRENHSERACMERVRKGLPEIFEPVGNYDRCRGFGFQKAVYYFSRPFDWIFLTGFYLKNAGFKEVIDRAKGHLFPGAYGRGRN